ncbi:MAG: hypothetical protein CVU46_18030 [Chloroflexi bacterium HGW-Chloroflexi-8]|nr:MAG: hypothetical protein CVU46_18030 [Chloroflexi bacterium HGW-Chloroflexi-8]
MRKRKSFVILSILVISSLACSFNFFNLFSIEENSTPEISTLAFEEAPSSGSEATDQQEETPEIQNQETDQKPGFTELNSYRTKLTMTLIGIDQNGVEVNEITTISQDVIKDQGIYHFGLDSENNGEIIQNLDLYTVDFQNYYLEQSHTEANEPFCVSNSGSEAISTSNSNFESLSPEKLFSDIKKNKLLEEGITVNGIMTNHYSVADATTISTELVTGKAEIWFAQEGDYVVRFVGEGEGETSSGLNGNLVTGKMTWVYDLSDANLVKEIPLPEKCQASSNDILGVPTPENVESVNSFGSTISFVSPDEPAVVAEYYKETLPVKGFSQTDISEFESVHILLYEKDGKIFTVVISPGDNGGSAVLISSK